MPLAPSYRCVLPPRPAFDIDAEDLNSDPQACKNNLLITPFGQDLENYSIEIPHFFGLFETGSPF